MNLSVGTLVPGACAARGLLPRAGCWALLLAVWARAASPQLDVITPPGAQAGTDVQFTLSGARLEDAAEIFFYRPGITVTALTVENATTVRADCTVAPDCVAGELPLRLRTATGISELRTIHIGALPGVAEVEPNNEFAAPQPVPLNVTINGVITGEDVDCFAVEVPAGQRFTAEIEGMRLGRAMFDPAVEILDARRFAPASCDDSSLLLQDSVASLVAPAGGTYVVRVREASYGGGDACHYRLHLGTFPRPVMFFPAGGAPGAVLAVTMLGDVMGPRSVEVAVPADVTGRFAFFARDEQGVAPSPNWLRVSALPSLVEPQTGGSAAPEPAAVPTAFDGVLASAGDADVHRFTAAKGQAVEISVFARRVRSPLDSVLEVLDEAGKVLAANDDAVGVDSYLRWTAPADGTFAVRVRDQRGRGGPEFVYRLELDHVRPELGLTLERFDAKRPQFLQAISVARGNRMAAVLRVERRDFDAPATIEWSGLPAGLVVSTEPLPAGQSLVPVVFEAGTDAPAGGGLVSVHARSPREGGDVVGGFVQRIPLTIAAPNETVYYETSVDRLAVAVAEPAPFSVRIEGPPQGVLRRGAAGLRVLVDRAEGFADEVVVHMLWNPPGLSSVGSITIPGDRSEGLYALNAAGDAPCTSWKVGVLARGKVGEGDRWVSSMLADLGVGEVFMDGKIELAALQQGTPGSVLCGLTSKRPFEGKARLTLLGLPARTSAEPVEVGAADTQAVFEVRAEADAPLGQHGGLFCELVVQVDGRPSSHSLAGGGAIRIDAPAPATAAVPAAAPAAPEAPKPAPLSRLEQLRKEAAERGAASGKGGR